MTAADHSAGEYHGNMSIVARRIVSWLAVLLAAGSVGYGLQHLPGASGPAAEVRWLLEASPDRPRLLNRAGYLLRHLDKHDRPAALALIREGLYHADLEVTRSVLRVLGDTDEFFTPRRDDVRAILSERLRTILMAAMVDWLPESAIGSRWSMVDVWLQAQAIYGDDWRRILESGSPTSQPSGG